MKLKSIYLLSIIALLTIQLKATSFDTTTFLNKVYLAYELEEREPDSAFSLAKELKREAIQVKYRKGIAYAELRMGSIYMQRGVNDSALLMLESALKIGESVSYYRGATTASLLLGHVFKEKGEIDSAFYYYYSSLRVGEESNDSIMLIDIYLELAHLNFEYKQASEGYLYYRKAIDLAHQLSNLTALSSSYSGLGNYYYEIEKYDSSIYYYNLAIEGFSSMGNKVDVANCYNNIAGCLSYLERSKLSTEYYRKALREYQELKMLDDVAICLYNLGSIFQDRNLTDSSILYFEESKLISEKVGNLSDQADASKALSIVYQSVGNYELAYQNHLIYSTLKDSLLNEEKVSSIAEMQTKYETDKKEQQIELLDEQNKTKEAQRNFLLAASMVLVLTVFVLAFSYTQRKRIAKKNELIAQQEIESLMDEQEIKTYNAMLEGQEEERMRIAADLHDRLGSMLSTVKLLFSALDDKIDKHHEVSKDQYAKANQLLDDACDEVRRVSHNLGTGMVANFGLSKAVEELCESIDQSGKVECQVLSYGVEEAELKLNTEVGIYRMVQEIVNNTIKHSKAKNLSVQLNALEETINITIEDDGVGFDLKEAKSKSGMGLSNLEKRAIKLGGNVHIDTQKGRGTTTIIEVPLNQEA